jgi:predicted small lipoprotein YifL
MNFRPIHDNIIFCRRIPPMHAMTALATIGCALLMPACGIKGPLYLPSPPAALASQPAAPTDGRNDAGASVPRTAPVPEDPGHE